MICRYNFKLEFNTLYFTQSNIFRFSKAFNSFGHFILLSKFEHNGNAGIGYNWM